MIGSSVFLLVFPSETHQQISQENHYQNQKKLQQPHQQIFDVARGTTIGLERAKAKRDMRESHRERKRAERLK